MTTISLICFPAAIIYTIWWIWYFCLMASLYSHCLPWPTRMHGMSDQYSAGIRKKKWASGVLYENQKLWSAAVMAESYITDAIPSAMNHVLPVVEITWFLPVWIVIAVTALVWYHVCAIRGGKAYVIHIMQVNRLNAEEVKKERRFFTVFLFWSTSDVCCYRIPVIVIPAVISAVSSS